jgi:CheY-like chemotaxis protein
VPRASILWAEDSRDDQELLQAALQENRVRPGEVAFVDDGVALLDRLARQRPAMVVVDIKMPRMGGIEALRRIRADERLRDLPCVVFSSSRRPEEIAACEDLGALACLQKPLEFDGICKAVRRILDLAAQQVTTPAF